MLKTKDVADVKKALMLLNSALSKLFLYELLGSMKERNVDKLLLLKLARLNKNIKDDTLLMNDIYTYIEMTNKENG